MSDLEVAKLKPKKKPTNAPSMAPMPSRLSTDSMITSDFRQREFVKCLPLSDTSSWTKALKIVPFDFVVC